MADNRITINAEFGQNYKDLGFIGRVGENDSREIVFDCADALTQFPGASIVCVIKRACDTKPYSAVLTEDGNSRILPMSAVENAVAGQIMIELRAVSNDTILKSAMFSGRIAEALQGEGDRPGNPVRDVLDRVDSALQSATETQEKLLIALDGVDTAVNGANTAAENAQTVADTVQTKLDNGDFVGPPGKDGANGKDGAPGKDGKDGEQGPKGDTGATGPQGAPGSDASVTAENVQAALGYTPVRDVQMDGESLVQDSVATIPLAGYNRLGAIQLDPAGFAAASIEGKLALVPPTDAQISTHTHTQRPITPSCMDYALKTAMCDGKGAAWTENEQKAARERMGVDKAYELIESITTDGTAIVEREAEPNGTPYNLSHVIVVVTSPKNMESEITIYTHMSTGDAAQYSFAVFPKNVAYFRRAMYLADVRNGIMLYASTVAMNVYGNLQDRGNTDTGQITQSPTLKFTNNNIKKIQVNGANATAVAAGFLIQIYGVRA